MTDANHSSFRTFDPANEEGAQPPQRSALRERLRQGGASAEDSATTVRPYDPATMPPATPLEAPQSDGLRPLSASELTERAPPRPEAPKPAPEPKSNAAPESQSASESSSQPIGVVLEISGSGSQIAIDLQRLNECMEDADPLGSAGRPSRQPDQDPRRSDLAARQRPQPEAGPHRRHHHRQYRLSGRRPGGAADR